MDVELESSFNDSRPPKRLHFGIHGNTAQASEEDKMVFLGSGRWLSIALLAGIAISASGCGSDDHVENPVGRVHLFDENFGMFIVLTPSAISTAGSNTIDVRVLPNVSGTAVFSLEGREGYGAVSEPVTGDLTRVTYRQSIDTRVEGAVCWRVEFVPNLEQAIISVIAWVDSVDIDGVRYSVESTEAYEAFGDSFSNVLFRRVVLKKE